MLEEEAAGSYCGLVGHSPAMRHAVEMIECFSGEASSVLIHGETGTGKELVARALHVRSARAQGPFVTLACGAVPRELAESELFGHEAGAFTGARARHRGRVEQAQGGSLFLDDVDDLPLELQAKLLRFTEERAFERVGGERPLRADVRIISATKTALETLVEQGRFREDLYYRLRVLVIPLAPLRERRSDILPLARHFLEVLARTRRQAPKQLSAAAVQQLQRHAWPGNVRELRHAIEYAWTVSRGAVLLPDDFPSNVKPAPEPKPYRLDLACRERIDFRAVTGNIEQELLQWALQKVHGNQVKAAAILGLPRSTFYNKLLARKNGHS